MTPHAALVSIVLPTANRPDRIGTALTSVLAQTYERLEVIVVDDASATPVDDVVASVAGGDPRVRLIRRDVNGGAAAARNTGLGLAQGNFIAFLDDDDRWDPLKLAKQVAYLERHPDVGIVTCDHRIEGDTRQTPLLFRGAGRVGADQLLWVNFVGGFPFVMVRRHLVESELTIDESFACAEDWDLWLRCSRLAPIGRVREPLVAYVSHPGPRLTRTDLKRQGLELFEQKHRSSMSSECQAFNRAHQRMDTGAGVVKRAHVLRALATPSLRASALLVLEQFARQYGRLTRDPGLAERTLASVLARQAS
jgi:glycosyltransferase involved in cell wall biosynthesis